MANLIQTLSDSGHFGTLLKAIQVADLEDILSSEGPFTVLAPTDAAFSNADMDVEALLDNVPKLKRVLLYHVLSGDVRSDDLMQIDEAPTLEGSILAVEQDGQTVRVNEVAVTQVDLLSDNGTVHTIDGVLAPSIIEHEYD
jgi:uncharacterized surface protein with fasciclin (FAS1) repeats